MKREISRAVTANKMYKKACCTCRIVVLPIQTIAFLTFSLSSPSWYVKVPYIIA